MAMEMISRPNHLDQGTVDGVKKSGNGGGYNKAMSDNIIFFFLTGTKLQWN